MQATYAWQHQYRRLILCTHVEFAAEDLVDENRLLIQELMREYDRYTDENCAARTVELRQSVHGHFTLDQARLIHQEESLHMRISKCASDHIADPCVARVVGLTERDCARR